MMGMAVGFNLYGHKGISEALLDRAQAGCKVRILFLHKENPVLPELVGDTEFDRRSESKLRDIEVAQAHCEELRKRNANISVRQMRRGCAFVTTTRTEAEAVWVGHFYATRLRYCPVFRTQRTLPMHDLLGREFEALWQANEDGGPTPE